MLTIVFTAAPQHSAKIDNEADANVEAALAALEAKLGETLPRDKRSGFPYFDLYDAAGEHLGGG